MAKTLKKIGILTLFIISLLIIFNINSINAATTTLKSSNASVKSGETFSVTISSSLKLTGWTISLTDKGGCTFTSASGGEVNGTSVFGTNVSGTTSLATYKFKAPTVTKETAYTIKFSGTEMCDVDTEDVSSTSCKATITVKPIETTTNKDTTTDKTDKNINTTTTNKDTTTPEKPKEKSNNAYLSTLGVTPKDYDFSGFSKTKFTYNVTVPSDVDSLKVLYKTADSNAKVKVTGNSGFEVGSDNIIKIVVTAEDGKTTKTYKINVTKLAEEEEKPGNVIEDEQHGLFLTSLSVDKLELSPEFSKDIYSYTATLDDSKITKLEVKAKSDNEKVKIDISGNTDLVEGENTINILLTTDESSEQTVYQIVVTKEAQSIETIGTNTENTPSSSTDLIGSIKNYIIIAVCVIAFMIIAVIVLIILLRRENKRLNEEDDDEYEDYTQNANTEEYNVYKNDENEFVNNDIEKDNFIESLYKQRNGSFDEELDEDEKETLEEINRQTAKIFEEKEVKGQSVEYSNSEFQDENPLEVRRKRRSKGKHSL